mmetsp:Transcript_53296/g.121904  ORF Transcript_53296/g.121904 Transcript_53296/m.121904 type:complete len:455 (-) Transcript_53296:214-1578(-)
MGKLRGRWQVSVGILRRRRPVRRVSGVRMTRVSLRGTGVRRRLLRRRVAVRHRIPWSVGRRRRSRGVTIPRHDRGSSRRGVRSVAKVGRRVASVVYPGRNLHHGTVRGRRRGRLPSPRSLGIGSVAGHLGRRAVRRRRRRAGLRSRRRAGPVPGRITTVLTISSFTLLAGLALVPVPLLQVQAAAFAAILTLAGALPIALRSLVFSTLPFLGVAFSGLSFASLPLSTFAFAFSTLSFSSVSFAAFSFPLAALSFTYATLALLRLIPFAFLRTLASGNKNGQSGMNTPLRHPQSHLPRRPYPNGLPPPRLHQLPGYRQHRRLRLGRHDGLRRRQRHRRRRRHPGRHQSGLDDSLGLGLLRGLHPPGPGFSAPGLRHLGRGLAAPRNDEGAAPPRRGGGRGLGGGDGGLAGGGLGGGGLCSGRLGRGGLRGGGLDRLGSAGLHHPRRALGGGGVGR